MEILLNTDGWVIITFEDDTKMCIHTTLNEELLKTHGVEMKPNYFYDIDKRKFIPFRTDAISIDVVKEKPIFEEEVLNFASRFI